MDKKRSILNVVVSIIFRFILLAGAIVNRRVLIQYIGNDMNGLNALYTSMIDFLNVAELGVSSAIVYCMYKPIIEKNQEKLAALYQLLSKICRIVGIVIFLSGLVLLPMLPHLIKEYSELNANIYGTFFLMLFSVFLSYMFSAKLSLINAYKDDYITTSITSGCALVRDIFQIASLICTRSFTIYLICRLVTVVLEWYITDVVVRKRHTDIVLCAKAVLDEETKGQIIKNTKAMFMHKIGTVLVNSTDSMIIAAFVGVSLLGKYSNYIVIMTGMVSVISLLFTPLTSIVGHMFVSEAEKAQKHYQKFYDFNYMIGVIFFLGYYAVTDELIILLFGPNLELARTVVYVITLNYFIQFMRKSTLLFRDATGTFYNDRWKPVIEGVVNVILSVTFVKLLTACFGPDYGLVGVIVATIVTNLLICHVVEPYVIFKYAFHASAKGQYVKNYACIAAFAITLGILQLFMKTMDSVWIQLLVNGGISVAFSIILLVGMAVVRRKRYIIIVRRTDNHL